MERYWQHLVDSTQKRVEDFCRLQVKDAKRADCGRMESDMIEGKPTIYLLTDALCLYFCRESIYYKDQKLFDAVKAGVSFVERWQREDGSLDYPSCNFYSAPDTAFCFRRLYGAWDILRKYGETEAEKELEERYLTLLFRCAPILLHGGFHTPNHRWAVTAALLCLARLAEENAAPALEVMRQSEAAGQAAGMVGEAHRQKGAGEEREGSKSCGAADTAQELAGQLGARAAQYLAEGIDGDSDGEYAERSTGNYNAVVDKSLILAYEMTGDESYLGYVERNLQMMLYYFDGDDTVFTQNSTRQDHGKAMYPDQYLYLYTYMADQTGSPLFDAAAHKIIADNQKRGDLAPDVMYIFMTHESLRSYVFQGYGYPEEYRKFFGGSQVLRVKKRGYCYSVLNHKASFLFLKFGSLPVGLRIGEAYCDTRSFIPQDMELTEKGCVLHAVAEGWYYQPFSEPQGTSDWWKMDHGRRERIVTSRLDVTVTVKELEKGLEITVKAEGLKGLPLRVELDVPVGSVLENDTFRLTAGKGESLILRDGMLLLRHGTQRLLIGPGYGTHAFSGHYSGEEKNTEGYSIFLNDYTPYERTFHILEET